MKCHICQREMRVIDARVVTSNGVVWNTEETWRCDHCDGLWNTVKRFARRVFIRKSRS